MIESFFKSLKNNYLYKQKLRTIEDAKRCIRHYVNSHNTTPLKIFKGAHPNEIYNHKWTDEDILHLDKIKQIALLKRKDQTTTNTCKVCYL